MTRADLVRAFVRSDAEIATEIREDVMVGSLRLDKRSVQVQVEDGEVTLAGELDSRADGEELQALVSRVPGVVAVHSKLTWTHDQAAVRAAERRRQTMTPTSQLQEELDRARIDFDLIEHRHTETAGDEARAIGVSPDQVAKTVVLASGEHYVRAVVPASERLDLHKVRELLGDKQARLASEDELVLAYPMYELGAIPPFGVPAGDRVLFDRRLAQHDSVVLEAGSHNESLRLRTADLRTLSGAEVEDIVA